MWYFFLSLFDCLLVCLFAFFIYFFVFCFFFWNSCHCALSFFRHSLQVLIALFCRLLPTCIEIQPCQIEYYTVYHSSDAHTFIAQILLRLLLSLSRKIKTKLWKQPIVKIPIKMLIFFCEHHLQIAHYHLNTFLFASVCVRVVTTCQNYTYSTQHSKIMCILHCQNTGWILMNFRWNQRCCCCLLIYCPWGRCAFWHL